MPTETSHHGFALWFTGLPSAGKTTIAKIVEQILRENKIKVEVLDGDEVRENLSPRLGFSKEDRDQHIRRIAYVSKLLVRNGVVSIIAAISPYRQIRDQARQTIGRFVEIYVNCPVEVCIERDVKGLYKKALAGQIQNFTGISDPYEEPLNPELVILSHQETPEQSARRVIARLEELGYMESVSASGTR
jgi:adenylylsulfate kinase